MGLGICLGRNDQFSYEPGRKPVLDFLYHVDPKSLAVWNEARLNHVFLGHLYFACTQSFESELATNSFYPGEDRK